MIKSFIFLFSSISILLWNNVEYLSGYKKSIRKLLKSENFFLKYADLTWILVFFSGKKSIKICIIPYTGGRRSHTRRFKIVNVSDIYFLLYFFHRTNLLLTSYTCEMLFFSAWSDLSCFTENLRLQKIVF